MCYTIGILRMEEIKFFTFEGSIPRLRPDHRIDLHDEIQKHSAQTFFFLTLVCLPEDLLWKKLFILEKLAE